LREALTAGQVVAFTWVLAKAESISAGVLAFMMIMLCRTACAAACRFRMLSAMLALAGFARNKPPRRPGSQRIGAASSCNPQASKLAP
jgi:hypothetical protein